MSSCGCKATDDQVKEMVRQVYGAAAVKEEGCCGSPGDRGNPVRGGARTSLGCGDPLAMMEVQPGQTVVDIGSGPGLDALAAARRVGPSGRVIGVDLTEPMIQKARARAAAEGATQVEFRLGDADDLPVESRTADWVISNCVVNLVPDKKAAFREIFRVLRPGGRFSITDLVGENLPAEILEDRSKYCACIGGADSESEYLDAVRQAGLTGVRVTGRFEWEVAELAGTGAHVWSIKVEGLRPEAPA